MLLGFFAMLLCLSSFTILAYCYFNKPVDGIFVIIIFLSFIFILSREWYLSSLSISLLIYSFLLRKKTSYTQMVTFSMIGSIALSFFLINFFIFNSILYKTFAALLIILFLSFLAIQGIFEDDLEKYLLISNFIQTFLVFLDLTIASIAGGKIVTFGKMQAMNYAISGSLLFLTMGILSKDNKRRKISQLRGSNHRNHLITIAAIISCISLAGLPGLNMFLPKWILLQKSYMVSPALTILSAFLTLLMFIMYFKIIYYLSSGESKVREKSPTFLNILAIVLVALCIVLGLIPTLQYILIEMI